MRSFSIFGSVARDEAEPTSELDVFVEPGTDAFYALRNYVGAYGRIADAFPTMQVGYATRGGLARDIREAVEREAIRVFRWSKSRNPRVRLETIRDEIRDLSAATAGLTLEAFAASHIHRRSSICRGRPRESHHFATAPRRHQ